MEKPDAIVFSYQQNSRSEGWRYIFLYFIIVVLLIVAVHVFYPGFPSQYPFFYAIVVALFVLVGIGVVIVFAMPGILRNEEFSFIVSSQRVSCFSPKKESGASFTLLLDDILAVQMQSEAGGIECWYILTHGGERFVITPDFGNPVQEVVRTLLRLRPDLEPRRYR